MSKKLTSEVVAGIVAIVIIIIGVMGYSRLRSSGGELAADEQKKSEQQVDQEYRKYYGYDKYGQGQPPPSGVPAKR